MSVRPCLSFNWLFAVFVPFCLLVVALTGCEDTGKVGYVSGTVKLDGTPLPDAFVTFQPRSGSPAMGVTDANGYYSLKLTADQTGVEVGEHQVSISTFWIDTADDGTKTRRAEKVPAKYNEESELVQKVDPGSQTIDFELSSN